MSRLAELLPHTAPPVSLPQLEETERKFGTALPRDLREFLLVSDGSTWTDFAECGFQIHALRQMFELWSLPQEDRAGPQHLIDIASDGSRERFCFDPLTNDIILLDLVTDKPPVACASTVTELVEKLSAGWNPFSVYEE